jgi:hypothetical protein
MGLERQKPVTEKEVEATVSALQKIVILKNIPQRIFDVFQKVFGCASLEVVPIRYSEDGEIEVFMTKRPENDTYWPNEWHIPGTMVFAWDWFSGNKFDVAWKRLKKKEIIQDSNGSANQVDTLFLNTKRGAETAIIHNLVFKGPTKSDGGKWHKISELPENIIEHHKEIVFWGIHDFVASVMSGNYNDSELSQVAVDRMNTQITGLTKQ